jgi:hypothetical protein
MLSSVQAGFLGPVTKNTGVLPRPQMGWVVALTKEEEVIGFQRSLLDPCRQCVSGSGLDLELEWALGLVLHEDGTCGQLLTMAQVTNPESDGTPSAPQAVRYRR